jgi:hypothetical protein
LNIPDLQQENPKHSRMGHAKWNVEDIELTRKQLNHLQQRLEDYTGAKKLGLAFWRSIVNGIGNRIKSRIGAAPTNKPADDFSLKNPDFKPY